jgi:hypothetical protein
MKRTIQSMTAACVIALGVSTPTLVGSAAGEGYGASDTPSATAVRPDVVAPGSTYRLRIGPFAPNTPVTVVLGSEPAPIGTFTADAAGMIDLDVQIPIGVPAGPHRFVASGVDANGAPVSRVLGVVVEVGDASNLALTGADAGRLLALGGMLIVIGTAGTVAARRRLHSGGSELSPRRPGM